MQPTITTIAISRIKPNKGQLEGLPKNPRLIKDDKYRKLKASIEENPEMLGLRPIMVYPHNNDYIVIGGNMRLHACKDIGYKELPCVIIPATATIEQLKAYTIKDNNGYGEWDFDLLANEWDAIDLDNWGVDVWPDEAPALDDPISPDAADDDSDENAEPIICRCKHGETWRLGNRSVICNNSDCEECEEK